MISLNDQLVRSKGQPTGFDCIRVLLAMGIICYHTAEISYGVATESALRASPIGLLTSEFVSMFFSLSGFLVAGSLLRCKTVISFVCLRVLRIFPALCAEVILSAFLLGPIFTLLPLTQYFSDPKFFAYFHNLHGNIHYYLPGVFVNNPIERVNGQLWTIPGELQCYIVLSILFLIGIVKRRKMILALIVAVQIYVVYKGLMESGSLTRGDAVDLALHGRSLVLCFLFGVGLYLLRDSVPWDWRLGIAAGIFSFIFQLIPNGAYFAPGLISYMTVFLGLLNPRKVWLLRTGDYSYGMYLYGYPLQQAIAYSPSLRHWWINLIVGLPLAFAFALLSWHILEKRALRLKALVVPLETLILKAIRMSWSFVARRAQILEKNLPSPE